MNIFNKLIYIIFPCIIFLNACDNNHSKEKINESNKKLCDKTHPDDCFRAGTFNKGKAKQW